jgi:hypothetical protein
MVFGRRGGDVDFTALKKRGLLNMPERKIDSRVKIDKDGSIDFTGLASSISSAVNSSNDSSSFGSSGSGGAISPFGFLDNLSSASSSSSSAASSLDSTLMQSSSSELSALKIKIDDLDFKLSGFMERMNRVESKLSEFESKVG